MSYVPRTKVQFSSPVARDNCTRWHCATEDTADTVAALMHTDPTLAWLYAEGSYRATKSYRAKEKYRLDQPWQRREARQKMSEWRKTNPLATRAAMDRVNSYRRQQRVLDGDTVRAQEKEAKRRYRSQMSDEAREEVRRKDRERKRLKKVSVSVDVGTT